MAGEFMMWVKRSLEDENLQVVNLPKFFENGKAFCALIYKFHPEEIDYPNMVFTNENTESNIQLAIDIAAKFGVTPTLTPKDVMSNVNKLQITQYLLRLRQGLENTQQTQQSPSSKDHDVGMSFGERKERYHKKTTQEPSVTKVVDSETPTKLVRTGSVKQQVIQTKRSRQLPRTKSALEQHSGATTLSPQGNVGEIINKHKQRHKSLQRAKTEISDKITEEEPEVSSSVPSSISGPKFRTPIEFKTQPKTNAESISPKIFLQLASKRELIFESGEDESESEEDGEADESDLNLDITNGTNIPIVMSEQLKKSKVGSQLEEQPEEPEEQPEEPEVTEIQPEEPEKQPEEQPEEPEPQPEESEATEPPLETQLEPQPESQPEEPQPEPQPEEPQPEVQPEVPEIQPEIQPEVPEIQPEIQPEVPEIQPEVPEIRPEIRPEIQPEVPEIQPEVPEIQPEIHPETQPEVPPEVQPEVPPEVQPVVIQPEVQLDTPLETQQEAQKEEQQEIQMEIQLVPQLEGQSKVPPETQQEAQSEAQGQGNAQPEVQALDKAQPEVQPQVKAQPEVQLQVKAQPEVPVKAQPEVPVKAQPEVPVKAQPEVPVKAQPETQPQEVVHTETQNEAQVEVQEPKTQVEQQNTVLPLEESKPTEDSNNKPTEDSNNKPTETPKIKPKLPKFTHKINPLLKLSLPTPIPNSPIKTIEFLHQLEKSTLDSSHQLNTIIASLHENLHIASSTSTQFMGVYKLATENLTEQVNHSAVAMHALIIKAQQLNDEFKRVETVYQEIKAIRQIIDDFDLVVESSLMTNNKPM